MAPHVYDPARLGLRLPVKSWAAADEDTALAQAFNLANLPVTLKHVALMPDAHAGYGMPIGGVLFTERALIPYAIGVDIGCGVVLLSTGLKVSELDPTIVPMMAEATALLIPAGFGVRAEPEYTTEQLALVMERERPASVHEAWMTKAHHQMGTLGGGNHFIEFQQDEDGFLFVMLHSGSRSLGKSICDFYHKRALEENERYRTVLPHKDLAFLPQGGKYFKEYWEAMSYALRWAEVNRDTMLMRVIDALYDLTKADVVTIVADIHHNYAAWENHFGQNGIVHRKGAVRAREGETVLIPGSMGTASYVGTGLGNPESFHSCQHGAGRAQTRTAMRKSMTADEVYDEMRAKGIVLVSSDPGTVMEEATAAYKDIEDVMERSSALVTPTKRLTPLAVVKG